MIMLFWTARWVASDATFLARLMVMSARDARGPEDHDAGQRPAFPYPTGGASNLATIPSSAFVGAG